MCPGVSTLYIIYNHITLKKLTQILTAVSKHFCVTNNIPRILKNKTWKPFDGHALAKSTYIPNVVCDWKPAGQFPSLNERQHTLVSAFWVLAVYLAFVNAWRHMKFWGIWRFLLVFIVILLVLHDVTYKCFDWIINLIQSFNISPPFL